MTENQHIIQFSKSLITASHPIFETMFQTKINPLKPKLKESDKTDCDISSIMNFSGIFQDKQFFSLFILSWPKETYLKMASMLLGEEYSDINEDNFDVCAEVNNMIAGNAKKELATLGYKIDMAIPSIIQGQGHKVSYPKSSDIIVIPFMSTYGEFSCEVCFTWAPTKASS